MINIFWFRRDLRLKDNAGLYHALKAGKPVLPIFIFDKNILQDLEDRTDARVTFIYDAIKQLKKELQVWGSTLIVEYGKPFQVWSKLIQTYEVSKVFLNKDYEPYALQRDKKIWALLASHGIDVQGYKDHVIFEKKEVVKKDNTPYTVFTPYSRRWKEKLTTKMTKDAQGNPISFYLKSYPTEKYLQNLHKTENNSTIPTLENMDFERSGIPIPSKTVTQGLIKAYGEKRDFPAQNGTSKLGIHFRFGTISIREKARKAQHLSPVFLNELIWRDFYAMILANFPKVVTQPFRQKYDFVEWRNNEEEFKKWCAGKTGYPMVDAGMRELNTTGFMHNRVRMITASFLTKHLLIDWRWGEAYFAKKLLDFDLASNNGGWQWAAGCGTDAAPYFRIFNPTTQLKKFDPKLKYVKKWIPEFGSPSYPLPIVEHKFARKRCLETYKRGLLLSENRNKSI